MENLKYYLVGFLTVLGLCGVFVTVKSVITIQQTLNMGSNVVMKEALKRSIGSDISEDVEVVDGDDGSDEGSADDEPGKDIGNLNILLLGLDGDDEGNTIQTQEARTDTIVLASINPKTKKTLLTSVPRDTRVYYPELMEDDRLLLEQEGISYRGGFFDKINHAYVYGGPDLTKALVEDLYQVPIDYYVVVNMSGMASLVDAIGGVEVTSPITFNYRGTNFVEGDTREVNGVKAINFIRMRYDDPEGDFGRQKRQKLLIKAILGKLLGMNIMEYQKLIGFATDYIRTDFKILNVGEVINIFNNYKSAIKDMDTMDIRDYFGSTMIDGVYYGFIYDEGRLDIINKIRGHLGLLRVSLLNTNYYDRDIYFEDLTGQDIGPIEEEAPYYQGDWSNYSQSEEYTVSEIVISREAGNESSMDVGNDDVSEPIVEEPVVVEPEIVSDEPIVE